MVEQLFTKEDILKFGFVYEPDESKCFVRRINNTDGVVDKSFIASKIWMKNINSVSIYENKILIKGHGHIDIL